MDKKIYTYGLIIVIMILLSISAAYMVPDRDEIEGMNLDKPGPGIDKRSRFGRGGKVRTISHKDHRKPTTRKAGEDKPESP